MEELSAIIRILEEVTESDLPMTGSTRLTEDLAMTSLQMMILITKAEDEFHRRVALAEVAQWKTVGDVAAYFRNKE